MDSVTWDRQDQELMDSLEALAPLLGTRKQQDASDDRQHKRHKPTSTEATGVTQRELAMTQVIKAMANLLLNHDRSLQNLHKQDSFVIFARAHPIGMMPIMAVLAKDWKEKMPQNRENPQWLTLRTHLLKGLMQELLTRVVQISESQVGSQLWDTAVAKKTILPDGAWVYQKWSPSEQQLVQAQRAPMPMAQMVKTLKTLIAALQDNMHVLRFHSLRTQQDTTPWILQLTMRDSELWAIFNELTGNSVWGLLAMSLKQHQQSLSKQAQALSELVGKGKGKSTKGAGKGKQPPKTTSNASSAPPATS